MKKFIVIVLFLFILSGCHANVDINIDSSLNVSENVEVKELISQVNTTDSYDNYIDEIISYNFKSSEIKPYTKTNIIDSNYVGLNLNRNHSYNICLSIKNSSLKYAMHDLNCEEEDGVYTITGTPTYFVCGQGCFMKPEVTSATLNISLPNEAISSNAHSQDGNIYTWNFEGSEDEHLDLKFKILSKDESNTILEENTNQESKRKNTILIILVVLIIGIALSLLIMNLYKKYKNNKLEY